MIAQLCLGFVAFLTRVAWGHDAVQPELPMVVSTVAHVAVGALLLATTVVLAIQVWRHVPVAFEERSSKPGTETGGRMSTATQPLVVPRSGAADAGARLCRTDQAARDHADHHDRVVRILFWRVEIRRLFPFVGLCFMLCWVSDWFPAGPRRSMK